MSKLRARKPDPTMVTKPKLMLFGPPGVGKTWVSLDFPKVYYIDTEGGATQPEYQQKLLAAGGVYFGKEEGSNHFPSVIAELKALAAEKHDYLTVVVDSFSKLYNIAAAQAEAVVGNDYGKDRKEANKPTRQLMLAIERLDMNVVLICHAKDKWSKLNGNLVNEGLTFDGFEKLEYDLHLCLMIDKAGNANVHKTRLAGFPKGTNFRWGFAEFEKRAGSDLLIRPPQPFVAATPEQVAEVHRLIGLVKLDPPDWDAKCLAKAGVEEWADMSNDTITACIAHLKKIVTGGGEEEKKMGKKK